jgi:hypothetical protein
MSLIDIDPPGKGEDEGERERKEAKKYSPRKGK